MGKEVSGQVKNRRNWLLWVVLAAATVLAACSPAPSGDQPAEGRATTAVVEATGNSEDTAPTEEPAAVEANSNSATDKGHETTENRIDESQEASDADTVVGSATEIPATTESPAEVDKEGFLTEDNRTERQRLYSAGWNTNWKRHTVPYEELLALLPVRDGIPAIDKPQYVSPAEAAEWLAANEPVIAFEANGDARAYPLQLMTYHEIVNDVVGEMPVTVTFCPLCNSAIVFDRRLEGKVYDFGTSGWLRNSDLVMYDRQTESLWQQFTGEGIVGDLAGAQLDFLSSAMVSFADFSEAYPEGLVLSRDTGFDRPYGQNPYPGYDTIGQNPFAFVGVPDGRLAAMERVIAVSAGEINVAYPLSLLFEEGVINDYQGGQDLVIFHVGGAASALDSPIISRGEDVGASGVFDPNVDGRLLTFSKEGEVITDEQTGSTWNVLGQAIDGPLAGQQLAQLVHGDYFWFAWAAFRPDTVIFGS